MITTVTMNASIDKAYLVDGSIQGGTVTRVASRRNSAGGKGLNVSRIIKLCEAEVLATGMAGGHNGAYLEDLMERDGIPHHFAHVKGETRSCINILDQKYGSTEFLEPGCKVSQEETEAFLNETFPEAIAKSEVVTISGSVPEGVEKDVYYKMILQAKNLGKKVLLDTSGELLRNGINASPFLIKPNRDELEAYLNIKITDLSDVIKIARKLHEGGIAYAVVSLGKEGALMACDEGVFKAKPPEIKAVNTVGCGDSMVGAFAVAIERGYGPEETLAFAAAVSAANALSPETGNFDPERMMEIRNNVKVERI